MMTAEDRKELCATLRAHQFGSAADEIEALARSASCGVCAFAIWHGFDTVECRRNAPAVEIVEASIDARKRVPVFPIMRKSDRCGQCIRANEKEK